MLPENLPVTIQTNPDAAAPDDCQTVTQYLAVQRPPKPVIAIGAGPYQVSFQDVVCSRCGKKTLIRQYGVSTLALVARSGGLTDEEKRAQVAAMNTIALAMEFNTAPLWLVPDEPGLFIGLGTFYRSFPPWVTFSNLRLAEQLRVLNPDPARPGVAPFAADVDASDRRCLHQVCRDCRCELPRFDNLKAFRFSFPLTSADSEAAMEPWAVVVGGIV